MDALSDARQLAAGGRYADALKALDGASVIRKDRDAADVLRAELLERTGRHGQSRLLLHQLLKSKDLAPTDRSRCETVHGLIEAEDGDYDSAIIHLQRSLSIDGQLNNLERRCWSQLRLLPILSDRSGPDATTPLMPELRSNATTLGDRKVIAAVHIFVGQTDAKRGLLHSALRHTRLGLQILSVVPDLGLEAMAENTLLSVAMMRSEFDTALSHAQRGVQLAHESGAAVWRRAFLNNLGHLFYLLGRFDESVSYYEGAQSALPSVGDNSIACLSGMAEVRLTQGRLDESEVLLDRIERSIRQPSDRIPYGYRHALLTRTRFLATRGQLSDALSSVDSVSAVAVKAGDHLLCLLALLTKAEFLDSNHRLPELLSTLDGVVISLTHHPDLYAQYERILACALAASGQPDAGRAHLDRAKRIYEGLHHVPGMMELSRCWALANSAAPDRQATADTGRTRADAGDARAQHILQSASALMLLAGRPELLAREIVHLLADTACVRSVTAVSRADDGQTETFASAGGPAPPRDAAQRLEIGLARERTVEVFVEPKPDIESIATLNAVKLLLAVIHDLERARVEREETLTLWPIEDVPIDGGQAVVGGQMRELMTFARRIATTNVSVLITGESGTGKEILARAIHAFSNRAARPFVPFNCTAVPHELLESQLFGHRRGAFTGADRDASGLIRSARDGTLFLDEIGELGLDLQPKLLRFLESGEISPLGEPALTVDVRIVAATNTNLDQLVQDGRFREDLFYRLNVIRLRIPPLRDRRDEIPGLVSYFVGRAAEEFKKGQVRVAEETMEYLLVYTWPGNVRQLNNELRRMVALANPNAVLSPAELSADIFSARPVHARRVNGTDMAVPLHDKLVPTLSKIEREMIKAALRTHSGKMDAAAKALGISRKGLYLKRQRLGL